MDMAMQVHIGESMSMDMRLQVATERNIACGPGADFAWVMTRALEDSVATTNATNVICQI